MFDLELEWTVGGRGQGKGENLLFPSPTLLILTVDHLLEQIFFSSQPSAAIEIKDGSHNFR